MRGEASIARRLADRALATASGLSPWVARHAGGRLLRQHRYEEAERLLSAASLGFPDHVGLRARHALAAEVDGRFAEGAARWREVCGLAPGRAAAWRGLAYCLRMQDDFAGAAVAMDRAVALRPNDWAVLLESARVKDRTGRHAEAAVVWSRLVRRRPADPVLRQGYADCLTRLDRHDEAAAQIVAGLQRHPGHRCLVAAQGLLAMRKQDWDEASVIWSRYVADFPGDESGQDYLSRVNAMRQLEEETRAGTARMPMPMPVAIEQVEDAEVRALLLRFESIGIDCEFGLAQRRYGAEPLNLLRWSAVTPSTLAAALEARFVDMGEPETTTLTIGVDGEILVRDLRWDLSMNTFLFVREVSPEVLYPKMCRRVVYLRDKFVADLEAAEKILFFKSSAIDLAGLRALHHALRQYGQVRLVNVRRADVPLPGGPAPAPGEVARVEPDLWVGALSRLGSESPAWNIAYDEWVSICRALAEEMAPAGATMPTLR